MRPMRRRRAETVSNQELQKVPADVLASEHPFLWQVTAPVSALVRWSRLVVRQQHLRGIENRQEAGQPKQFFQWRSPRK